MPQLCSEPKTKSMVGMPIDEADVLIDGDVAQVNLETRIDAIEES